MAAGRLAAFLDAGRSLEDSVGRVRFVESLGYDSAWVTHTVGREPLQVLAAYAAGTSSIGLGTGVVPMMLRHPALLAAEAATLDEASGGRLRLGIGVSHKLTIEAWYGLTLDDPVGRIVEYTTILRSLFRDGASTFEGKHYTSRFSFGGFTPRRDLRILWAAMGPRMVRAAAEHADGIVLWMCSPTVIRDAIRPALDEGLEEAGRSPDEFEVLAAVPVALTENADGARERFRRQALPYLNLPFYRKEIARAHADVLAAFDERQGAGDLAGAFEALGPEFTDDYIGAGDAEAVRGKIEDYRDAGVTLPAVGPLGRHEGSAGVEATLEAAVQG